LIAQKDWRAKLAEAIGVGIENYQALGIKKQPPMLVADYRRQGSRETLAPQATPPPQISQPASLESAAIVP
jgi:hypothetical protein